MTIKNYTTGTLSATQSLISLDSFAPIGSGRYGIFNITISGDGATGSNYVSFSIYINSDVIFQGKLGGGSSVSPITIKGVLLDVNDIIQISTVVTGVMYYTISANGYEETVNNPM